MTMSDIDLAVVLGAENKIREADKYRGGVERIPTFPVFITITLGLHKTAESYIKALESGGYTMEMDPLILSMAREIKLASTPTEVDLVSVSVGEDLGYGKGLLGPTTRLYDRGESLGLQVCPAEVGLALVLALPNKFDLLSKECRGTEIAMKPIETRLPDRTEPRIFFVSYSCLNNRPYYTSLCQTHPGGFQYWNRPEERLIFIQPRRS